MEIPGVHVETVENKKRDLAIQLIRNAFDRVVLEGEDIQSVLDEEGANLQALMDETGAPCWSPDPPSDGPCQVK